MGTQSYFKRLCAVAVLAYSSAVCHASVIYDGPWSSNEPPNGNYVLTVTDTGVQFNWHLTVNPWNAEALGLFVDLGAGSIIGPVNLTNVNPAGQVTVFATDTSSAGCGNGCNLNGLALPPLAGGDWELVFRLGQQGFNGIQSFSWTTQDFGLSESDFGVVGVRAQQLCSGTDTLPTGNCEGSDKSYGFREPPSVIQAVPEPHSGALALLGIALGALGFRRSRIKV